MADRWTGFDVSGEEIVAVTLEKTPARPYTVIADTTLTLQTGPRPKVLHDEPTHSGFRSCASAAGRACSACSVGSSCVC